MVNVSTNLVVISVICFHTKSDTISLNKYDLFTIIKIYGMDSKILCIYIIKHTNSPHSEYSLQFYF